MKNSTRLSTIALLAATLAATPAAALTLNLGGSGSDSGGGDAAITVDTGDLLGGGDSSGGDTNAVIDLNLNGSDDSGSGGVLDLGSTGNLIDLGGDDDDAAVVDLDLGTTGSTDGLLDLGGGEGTLLDLGDGPLLDLSGGEEGTLLAIGDGGVLDLTSTGSIGDSGDGLLDLGGGGNLLDLGSGEDDVTADLGDTDVIADLNLEGDDEPAAQVNLLSARRGIAGTGALSGSDGVVTLGNNAATIALTGDDDSGASDSTTGGGDDGTGGSGGSTGGSGDDGSATGGTGADDGTAGDGAAATGTTGGGAATSTRVATNTVSRTATRATTDQSACLSLTGDQLNQLVDRHSYDWNTFSSWADADALRVIEVDVCGNATAQVDLAVESSANVARLQAFLASQAKVREGLQQTGHTADDVIAADGAGDELVVYVTNG